MRMRVAALALSAAGLIGLAVSEGYREEAYIPVPGDVPTIGYGSTKGVKLGDRTDPISALQRKARELQEYEGAVKRCVTVPLYQHEYDSYTSFSYNVGTGAFCGSTLVRRLNAGDYAGACAELDKWVYVKGRRVQGLVNRRAAERALCEGQ